MKFVKETTFSRFKGIPFYETTGESIRKCTILKFCQMMCFPVFLHIFNAVHPL